MDDKTYRLMANALRFLSIDAIEKANSGHPGMPMGMADVATMLFNEFLKFDPDNPKWHNRDRFILSAGHGSMLLYSLLYLTGYKDICLEDLKNFRQLHSKTAGHPEHQLLQGIETTTGPLGQGLANAVGIAIAERLAAAQKPEIDYHTYVIVGDGCLMEGISQEAISLAGHLKLRKLIVLFDDNKISIDGPTSLTTSENTQSRFEACGFNVQAIDGHDFAQIRAALFRAKRSENPSLIMCKTIIGYGSPHKGGSEKCHGAALGPQEVVEVRTKLNWPYEPFEIPNEILQKWRKLGIKSSNSIGHNIQFNNHGNDINFTELKTQLLNQNMPTRKASGIVLSYLAAKLPELIGGSADLSDSNNTKPSFLKAIHSQDFSGRYIYYGVREHAMAAIMNGLALSGGFLPYGGTFLVFSDYMRPAIRLSALMELQVWYVMTHDSIGLGEDGPTHQPVEHLASLRAIPNLYVFRPACAIETAECYEVALSLKKAPSLFSLTRQNVPALRTNLEENLSSKGAYILSETSANLDVTIFATGSEVSLAIEAKNILENKHNIGVRVVSTPCFELFDKQNNEYKASILNNSSIKVAVEAGIKMGWEKYLDYNGIFIGMEGFGASAKAEDLYKFFNITKEEIVKAIVSLFSSHQEFINPHSC